MIEDSRGTAIGATTPCCAICTGTKKLQCVNCVNRRLETRWSHRHENRNELRELRAQVTHVLQSPTVEALRKAEAKLAARSHRCAQLKEAIIATSQTICEQRLQVARGRLDLHQRARGITETRDAVDERRRELEGLRTPVLEGLKGFGNSLAATLQRQRFSRALQLFQIFGLNSLEDEISVMSLALPGDVSYWVYLPHKVVTSALRLVATLVFNLANTLRVDLPHPIFPIAPQAPDCAALGDVTPTPKNLFLMRASDQPIGYEETELPPSQIPPPPSPPPLCEEQKAKFVSGQQQQQQYQQRPASNLAEAFSEYLGSSARESDGTNGRGRAAASSSSSSAVPAASPPHCHDALPTARSLLGNDVVHLCAKSGIEILTELHPAEEILFNLSVLRRHLSMYLAQPSLLVELPFPKIGVEKTFRGPATSLISRQDPAASSPDFCPSISPAIEDWELVN